MESHVHLSVLKKDNLPAVTRCTVCCKLFHCPVCPLTIYKSRTKSKVLKHLELHVKNALHHNDFYITKCHHDCRGRNSGHFHCPVCLKSVIKRPDMMRHLIICRPGGKKEAAAGAKVKMELKGQCNVTEDQTSTTSRLEKPPEGEGSAHDESSSLGNPLSAVRLMKMPTVFCPHCDMQVRKKNLKKHISRRHADKPAGDSTISGSGRGFVCIQGQNGVFSVNNRVLGSLGPLSVQEKSWGKDLHNRNRRGRDILGIMAAQEEFFPGIPKIPYMPFAGAGDVLCFKHYNADEVLMGKKMEDWLRFSVCYWHTFCGTGADPFGSQTLHRSWNEGTPMEAARKRLLAAFEFFSKLGVKYYTFHDRDMAPEGSNLEESNKNLEELTDMALQLQSQTGIKVLWVTCNLFAHPRYMNGAATNPDSHVVAYAGAQVKKGLDIAKKLGAENFVFWGGREGFLSIHNTHVATELKHMANFFKMAVNYKEKIGLKCQFLIEPKPKEPCKHQYDYDAMSVIGFLRHYGLENHFKLNIEPNHTTLAGHSYEHDVVMASALGMLGSVDSNTGSPDLGWDTDQFPMDIRNTTMVMKTVLEQGGLQPGGLNFDAKVRRESTELEDLFIAHIGAMDAFARGLRNAVKIIQDGLLAGLVTERYSSFSHGIGQKVAEGSATLEDMEAFIHQQGEPMVTSGKQEKYESIFNHYI